MSFNYQLALMNADIHQVNADARQTIEDGKGAESDMKIEEAVYQQLMKDVKKAEDNVTYWAGRVANDPSNKSFQAQLTAAQTAFQQAQLKLQTYGGRADAASNAQTNQVGQDNQNASKTLDLVGAILKISDALVQALHS